MRLARSSEGFDAECWCLHLLVGRDTLVLSSVEEVLTLMRDKRPLRKGAASVTTGCCSFARGLDTAYCIAMYALLLKQDLRWKR